MNKRRWPKMQLSNHEVECEICGKDMRGLMGSPCDEFFCVTEQIYKKDGGGIFTPAFKKGQKKWAREQNGIKKR